MPCAASQRRLTPVRLPGALASAVCSRAGSAKLHQSQHRVCRGGRPPHARPRRSLRLIATMVPRRRACATDALAALRAVPAGAGVPDLYDRLVHLDPPTTATLPERRAGGAGPAPLSTRHHRRPQPPRRALAWLTSTLGTTDQDGQPPRDRGTRRPAPQPHHQPDPGRNRHRADPLREHRPDETSCASPPLGFSHTITTGDHRVLRAQQFRTHQWERADRQVLLTLVLQRITATGD